MTRYLVRKLRNRLLVGISLPFRNISVNGAIRQLFPRFFVEFQQLGTIHFHVLTIGSFVSFAVDDCISGYYMV